MELRLATPDDSDAIAAVLTEAFTPYRARYATQAWAYTVPSPADVRAYMEQGPVWVAEAEGGATVASLAAIDAEPCYLQHMGAVPSAQGHGLGRRLMRTAEAWARQQGFGVLFLHTAAFLDAAVHVYESEGFVRGDAMDLRGLEVFEMTKQLS